MPDISHDLSGLLLQRPSY